MANLQEIIEEAFTQYSGAVIQSRALVDVRDCVKPSARQIYYSLFTDKFTADKPFKKTLKAIGSAMRFYIHGDASCEGIIMRSGQPFSLRYPLIEVEGSYGTLTETGNWAASRYTASRLSPIADYLLQDTNKENVLEWVDNYDDTEQYPRVLSSLGYYNIVNGSTGIAVGLASSIPQFNLTEVNNALITLLRNEEARYEDIMCFPDFATGGTIINKEEVFSSLKTGTGKSCVIEATISYSKKDNALVVEELPYGVYTNTICKEVEKLVNKEENIGITNINDLTGENVCIKIYLAKDINPDKVKAILYAETSLRKSYSINMTMLEDGRFPKVFGWKDCLLSHLKHEKQVYINLYNAELKKLNKRLNIVVGILKAIDNLEKVIDIIKSSNSTNDAKENLKVFLDIDDEQAKAILDIKLAKLAKLESNKYIQEKEKIENRINEINNILSNEELLKEQMILKLEEVKNKYGDERRTKVIQKEIIKANGKTKTIKEVIPEDVVITLNGDGYIKSIPINSFKVSKRGSAGSSISDKIIDTIKTNTTDMLVLFSDAGKAYRVSVNNIAQCGMSDKGTAVGAVLQLSANEHICRYISIWQNNDYEYMLFTTKNGLIKKTAIRDFIGDTQNLRGTKAITIKDGDSLQSIQFINDEDVALFTKLGQSIRFDSSLITPTGKTASGVKGINLNTTDFVVASIVINKDLANILLIDEEGYGKRVPVISFNTQGRGGKGNKCGETIVGAEAIDDNDMILLFTDNKNITIAAKSIPEVSKTALGNKLIKSGKVINICKL